MGWDTLPSEVQELILANFTPMYFARVATTCKFFHAMFPRVVAKEQSARCDVAAECFGRECIICIAGLLDRLFKGEALGCSAAQSKRGAYRWWISADGTLHDNGPNLHDFSRQNPHDRESVVYCRWSPYVSKRPGLHISVFAKKGTRISMQFNGHTSASIFLLPTANGDFEGVGLVQALLREGLARVCCDAGLPVHICVRGLALSSGLTQAGCKVHIAPILPYGTHCTQFLGVPSCWVEERVHIAPGDPTRRGNVRTAQVPRHE
jgi:hypothetical protein